MISDHIYDPNERIALKSLVYTWSLRYFGSMEYSYKNYFGDSKYTSDSKYPGVPNDHVVSTGSLESLGSFFILALKSTFYTN